MRSLAAVWCVAVVGCADPAARPAQLLTTSVDNGEYTVTAPDYAMKFSPSGVKLPTSLRISQAEEALASAACPAESLAGTGLYPAAVAAGGVDGRSDLVVNMAGPAVARVTVTYEVPYCGAQTLSGTSTFTFFPSGRIVRHDRAVSSSTFLAQTPVCGCGNMATHIDFKSFWRFKASSIVGLDGAPIPAGGLAQAGCVAGTGYALAFAWSGNETSVVDGGTSVATTYYFQRNVANLDVSDLQVTSALQIRGGAQLSQCADIHSELADHAITVANNRIDSDVNGVFVDPNPHTSSFDILARDGTLPGFAAVFTLPGFSHARVSQPEGTYTVQPYLDHPDEYLFWFERGVGVDDRITIEPY